MICMFFPLFFIKEVSMIVKISGIGHVSIYLYIGYIFYLFVSNLFEGNISKYSEEIRLFNFEMTNIATILGNFSLAFQVQNALVLNL